MGWEPDDDEETTRQMQMRLISRAERSDLLAQFVEMFHNKDKPVALEELFAAAAKMTDFVVSDLDREHPL